MTNTNNAVVTKALVNAVTKIAAINKDVTFVIVGDTIEIRCAKDILNTVDVVKLVKAGVAVDGEFSEDVAEYLDEQEIEFEDDC